MARPRSDSAERIIELSKVHVNRHFIQQIIIEEGYSNTSITTVDNYMRESGCLSSEDEEFVRIPSELWRRICALFSMKEELRSIESSISDSIKCNE